MPKRFIKIGNKAPTFTLTDQNDRTVSLKDLSGQWTVLYFYPKDDTPGCTTEACEFTSALKDFDKLAARVFGVSPDSAASHREFIGKHKLGVDLLSDPEHRVLGHYEAWGEKSNYGKTYEGVIRSTVILDPQGRVAHHWPKVKVKGHVQEVRDKLAELQAT